MKKILGTKIFAKIMICLIAVTSTSIVGFGAYRYAYNSTKEATEETAMEEEGLVNENDVADTEEEVAEAPSIDIDAIMEEANLNDNGSIHQHVFTLTENDPTCTEEGDKTWTCECGYTYIESVSASGHNYVYYYTEDPTCEDDGAVYSICTECGEVIQVAIIDATGHDYASEVVTPATCTTTGLMKYRCDDCGETYYSAIPVTGHDYEAKIVNEATCENEGEILYTCSVCGDSYSETTGKTEHTYVKTGHTNSTCNNEGSDVYTCEVCGDEKIVAIDAGEHDATDWIVDVEATCESEGHRHTECAECGAILEEETIDKVAHEESDWIVDVESTCNTKGSAHIECANCGEILETKELDLESHSYELTETIEPTCVEQGQNIYTCSVCGDANIEYIDTVEHTHSGEWEVFKEATEDAEGIEVERCSVCGNILQQRSIDKLEHTHNYETEIERVDATCETDGYVLTQCACGETEKTVIEATGHTAGEWEVSTPATFTSTGIEVQECVECGAIVNQRVIDVIPHGHEYEVTNSLDATCTNDGYKVYTCSICGDSYEETIEATGHVESEWIVDDEATCTEDGHSHIECAKCGEVLDTKTVEATGHTAGSAIVETKATCEEDGLSVVYCTECGERLSSEVIPATGHDYSEFEVMKKATCESDGVETKTCTNCGDTITQSIPATGHSFGEWKENEEGTQEYRECENCSAVETRDIEKEEEPEEEEEPEVHEHSFVESDRVESTCTKAGYVEYSCEGCDETYTEPLALAEHTAGDWEVVTKATETSTGLEAKYCTECGKELEARTIDKLEHTHKYQEDVTEATCEENGSIVYTCDCGDTYTVELKATGHTWGEPETVEATCTEDGSITTTCSTCGKETVEVTKAIGHKYTETDVVLPTCEENGYKEHTCSVCGDTYREIVKATGHDYEVTNTVEATCTEDGYIEHTCANCGDVYTETNGTATGHTAGEWTVTKAAEVGVEGEQVKYCTECGAILEKETIEALEEDEYDQTYYIQIEDGSTLAVVGHFDEARTNLMLEKINAYRVANGKDALLVNDALQTYTELRAVETSYLWAHKRSNGTSLPTKFGENIAWTEYYYEYYTSIGYDMDSEDQIAEDVNSILTAWQNSSGHNKNILGTNYDYIYTGLSCFMYKTIDEDYGDVVYEELWVQTFSTHNSSTTTTAATNATYNFK